MSAPPSAQRASSATSSGVETGEAATSTGRLRHLITPCRNLAFRFARNPRWGVMFMFGRFRPVGSAVAFLHRGTIVRPDRDTPSLFHSLDVDAAVANMRRDGLHTGIMLDADTVARIRSFADTTECYWSGNSEVRFLHKHRAEAERRCGKSILLGRYFDIEDQCDAIRAISHDPILHYLAAKYMGAPAGQVEARLWWSFVGEATAAERLKADQGFHYDLHDYRSIAFFFHLTDVDEHAGPHMHIRGSHVHKPFRLLFGDTRQASDEEMVKQYGVDNVATLCGPAGFGFATDPFGYHKGAPPTTADRLALRIRFTINDDGSRVDRSLPKSTTTRQASS